MDDFEEQKLAYLRSLRARAEEVARISAALTDEMNIICADIDTYNQKYPNDDLEWHVKEQACEEAEILFARMRKVEAELTKTEAEYNAIRIEYNTYHGEEILREINLKLPPEPDDETDGADWWKSSDA